MKDSIRKLSNHKATFAVLGFIAGLGTYWGIETLKPAPHDPIAQFLIPYDPISEIRKMQERLSDLAEAPYAEPLFAETGFAEMLPLQAALKVEEDEAAIYYDISVPDMKAKDIQVRVEDGVVVLQSKSERTSESDDQHSYFTSSFHQSFPWPSGVPADLDATKVKIKYEDDRVRIVFPKMADNASYT